MPLIKQLRALAAIVVLAFLCGCCIEHAHGEEGAVQIGTRKNIRSEILQEEREYLVYLPDSYDDDRYLPKSYPVLFVLDGGLHFHYVSGMTSYMGVVGQIPEMIVVAIPHLNRTRELTPTQSNLSFQGKETSTFNDSGGADDFLAFLTDELIPQLDEDYRTRPFRILTGHSFGGLFAAHAFQKGGDHFQAFLLADPSLWWDDQVLVKQMEEAIGNDRFPDDGSALFIATAERPAEIEDNDDLNTGVENHFGGIESFFCALEPATKIRRKLLRTHGETHGSVPVQTLYQGLRFVFDGYQPATELFLLEPGKLVDHYGAFSEKVGAEFLPDEQMLDMMALGMLAQDDFRTNAVRLLEINAENYPDSPNVYTSLAAALEASGDLEKARAQYERALELDPDNEAAQAGLLQLAPEDEAAPESDSTPEEPETDVTPDGEAEPVYALMTDHFEVEIAHDPETVWSLLKDLYIDGDRYRQRGLDVQPLIDDPTAHLGGLRATSPPGGPEVDLTVRFSTIDDESYFLATYLDGTIPQGAIPQGIYVTHDVTPQEEGCRYKVIIQTHIEVELEEGQPATLEAVRQFMTERVAAHKQGLEATVMTEIVDALDSK